MPTSFEVGSVFEVVDRATAVLARITRAVTQLNDQIEWAQLNLNRLGTVNLSRLDASLRQVQDQFAALNGEIDATVTGMSSATRAAGASVQNLARQWRDVNAAATSAAIATQRATRSTILSGAAAGAGATGGTGGRGPGGRGPGWRGGGPGWGYGGMHIRGPGGTSFGGGFSAHHSSLAGQGILAGIGYGVYEQSQLEDIAYRAMFTAGIPTDKATQQLRMRQVEDLIQQTASKTGGSINDIGEATLAGIRMMQGFSWDQRMTSLPAMLQFGAAEAKLKGTSIDEGTQVAYGLAHMFGAYTPQQIGDLANKIGYLSTMTPASPEGFERALGYSVPLLRQLNYDPYKIAMLTAMMQRGGILNTKSGTWIRNMAQMALPGTTVQSQTAFRKHEQALFKLGLVDGRGQPTFLDANGNPDIVKLLEIAGERINKMPAIDRAGIENQLFGKQGSGALAVLSNPQLLAMLPETDREMERFRSGADFFADYANNSPAQQFRQTWADMRNVLMDLGNIVLPPLTRALKNVDELLRDFTGNLAKLVPILAGAFAGYRVGGPIGAVVGGVMGAVAPNPQIDVSKPAQAFSWWNLVPHSRTDFGIDQGSPADRLLNWLEGDGQKKTIEHGTEQGARKGVADALKHNTAFFGIGPGGGVVPAAYYTGGGAPVGGVPGFAGGAGAGIPSAARGAISINPAGDQIGVESLTQLRHGLPEHWTTADIVKAVNGTGGAGSSLNDPSLAGLHGNAYIKALRAPFAQELQDPQKRLQFAAMLLSEGTPLPTAESAMNRSIYAHKTLMQMLHSGFYGPIKHGMLPSFMRRLQNDPKLMARMDAAINGALAGSDTIHGATDQGMFSDPNGRWPGGRVMIGGQVFNDWGAGPGGHSGAARWRQGFEAHADEEEGSPAIASDSGSAIHVHSTIKMDGRTIAKGTARHFAKMGNGPLHSGRLTDPVATTPLNI